MDEQGNSTIATTEITGTTDTTTVLNQPAVVTPPVVTPPAAESKVIAKELYDKTATELADVKKQLKAKMTADELAIATANEKSALEKAETEALRIEIENLRKLNQTSSLIAITSEQRNKIGFTETEKEFADVIEKLDYTTLGALINKISNVAYEKGKRDVTDSVMTTTGNLNLGGGAKIVAGNEGIEDAKRIAQLTMKKSIQNPYFGNK